MKKILMAMLVVMFTFSNAYARPMNHSRNMHMHNNRPHQHTTVIKKDNSGKYIGLGIVAGLTGLIVGSTISNNNAYYSDNTVAYAPAPVIVQHPQPAAKNCTTTVYQRTGQTTTTCYSNPQTNNVVYVY